MSNEKKLHFETLQLHVGQEPIQPLIHVPFQSIKLHLTCSIMPNMLLIALH